jgi:hypothetical protein
MKSETRAASHKKTVTTTEKTVNMKNLTSKSMRFIPVTLGLALALVATNARAQSQYFGTVANGNTYSWDAAYWNASGSAGNTAPYTFNWTAGDFARFYNGAGDTYTVTVNPTESMAGMYLNAGASVTLNINDAGNGTGALSIVPNSSIQDGFGYTQGFLTTGILTINVPIIGTGGLEEETGGGHLQLYGNNTYSGGTLFTSSSTYVDYNSSSSVGSGPFGTGPIAYYNTTFSIMENMASSTVTIGNNVQILGGTTGVNFIGNGTKMTGTWTMGSYNVNLRNNGVGTTVTLSGAMSGTGTVNFSGANGGTIIVSGANTYTGPTTIGVTSDTAITLQLGAANTIASSSSVVMSGGTLSPGGYAHTMGSTTLGLTANSTIDFTLGGSLSLADSSALTWSGHLDLLNYQEGELQFALGPGLTSTQLADIEFNNNPATLGTAYLDVNGVVVPEPSTVLLGLLGLGALWTVRRRTA